MLNMTDRPVSATKVITIRRFPAPALLVCVFGLLTLALGCTTSDLSGAAFRGDLSAVQASLAKGSDVNATSRGGVTALIMASQNGHVDVVRALLDAKADVNAKTTDGATALSLAKAKNHSEVVRLLQSAGAG
jgi:predicted LPLAT superfamily acyltransferase